MHKDDVKLILLQTRSDVIRDQEYRVILEILDIKPSQLKQVDAYTDKIDASILEGYDGIISGGDGEHSVLQEYAFMKPVNDLLTHCYEVNFPVFGICYGFQLLARAYGGNVVDDPALKETASIEVALNDAGKADPIFADIPEKFVVNSFHNQSVVALPEDAISLCSGPKDIHYACKYKDKKIYGTQFHLELDVKDVAARLAFYLDKYVAGGQDEYDTIMSKVKDTTPAKQMLRNFVACI